MGSSWVLRRLGSEAKILAKAELAFKRGQTDINSEHNTYWNYALEDNR